VIAAAYQKFAGHSLLLKMALEASIGIAFAEHFVVDGPMRVVARHTPFPQGFVFENKRTTLGCVALKAGFIFRGQSGASPFYGGTLMRIMTITAAKFAG